jgi:CheY-like chemotaxis protein
MPFNPDMTHPRFVILADDDVDDLELFKEIVNEINPQIKVQLVENGRSLLRTLHTGISDLPDIIFLDLNMPDKNGKECLIEIRKDERLKNIPVIIYSTSAHSRDTSEAYSNGANLYIRKPANYERLIYILQKVLSIDWASHKLAPTLNDFVL